MRENVCKYLLLFLLGCLEDVSGGVQYPYVQPVVVPQPQSQPVYASYNQPQQGYYQFPHRPTWPLYQPQQVQTTQQPRQVVYGYNQPQQVYQQPQYYQSSGTTNYQQQLSKPYYYQGSQPASSSHQSQTPIVQQKPVYQYQYYQPQQVQPTTQTYGHGYVTPSIPIKYAYAQPTSYGYVQPSLYNYPVSTTKPHTYTTTYPQPKPTITYVSQPDVQPPRDQYYYPPQPLTPSPAVQPQRGQYYYPPQPLTQSPPVYVPPTPVTSPPVPHIHVNANIHAHGSPMDLPPHAHVISDSVRVLSYNVFGSSTMKEHPQKAQNVFKAIRLANPDILGAQEVDGFEKFVAANIGPGYAVAGPANAGHAIIYRTSVFNLEAYGSVKLNEMDRIVTPNLKTQFHDHHSLISGTVAFARFNHVTTGRQVDVFNTHLCLCDEELLLASAKIVIDTIVKHRRPGSRVILTGDFNCEDGWENSKPVRYFKGLLGEQSIPLDDTFRSFNGIEVDGTTVPGKKGKKDYVMVDKGAVVRNAWIDRNWADLGHASNHWPVGAIIDLGHLDNNPDFPIKLMQ